MFIFKGQSHNYECRINWSVHLSYNNKWKNIVYDFSGQSNNCTLNVNAGHTVRS